MDPLKVVRIAFEVLSERVFTLLAMLMTFALSCWAMSCPTWERLGLAAFFAVAVYMFTLAKERQPNGKAQSPEA